MRYFLAMLLGFALAAAMASASPEERRSDVVPCLVPRDCFRVHLHEAIALNRERAPLYAAASGGRTRWLSRYLIGLELATLPAAYLFDSMARRYQEHGIPVLCAEFMPMSDAPPFVARVAPPETIPEDALALAAWPIARDLRRALAVSPAALAERSAAWLGLLATLPAFRCMTRHLVESIRRAALLAPQHDAAARAHGLSAPTRLTTMFLRAQIELLPLVHWIDRSAAPLQAEGIPILCRDVPAIPPP